jgi:hypothetical protein
MLQTLLDRPIKNQQSSLLDPLVSYGENKVLRLRSQMLKQNHPTNLECGLGRLAVPFINSKMSSFESTVPSGAVFTTLQFLHNLQMDPISWAACL